MARPEKNTVEYFPHYTASKKTIYTLEALYNNDGYAFWFKLLEILGASDGHFYNISKRADWLYLVSRTGVSEDLGKQILETLVDLEAIDGDLLENGLIWSNNFLENLRPVYDRRKGKTPEKPVIDNINPVNVDSNSVTDNGKRQSKGSKVKEVKESSKYGSFFNVVLSEIEHKKLVERFGDLSGDMIENLSLYVSSTGKKYKSHYATILSWHNKDEKQNKKAPVASTVAQVNAVAMDNVAGALNREAENDGKAPAAISR